MTHSKQATFKQALEWMCADMPVKRACWEYRYIWMLPDGNFMAMEPYGRMDFYFTNEDREATDWMLVR